MSELALVLFAALLPGMKDMQQMPPMQHRCPTSEGRVVLQARPCEALQAPPVDALARADMAGREARLPGREPATPAAR